MRLNISSEVATQTVFFFFFAIFLHVQWFSKNLLRPITLFFFVVVAVVSFGFVLVIWSNAPQIVLPTATGF